LSNDLALVSFDYKLTYAKLQHTHTFRVYTTFNLFIKLSRTYF